MTSLSPNPLVPLLWVIAVHLAAYAVGRPLYLRIRSPHGIEHGSRAILNALLLGFAALACVAFALAAAHLLFKPLIQLLVAGLASWTLIRFARHRPPLRWRFSWRDLPTALAILFLAQFIPEALSPVLQQDDHVYHLFLPKLYLERQQLVSLPWHINANMPHLTEILYALPMAIGDFTAPKILTLSFVALTLLALWSFSVERCGRFGSGLLLLIYLSGQNVQWHLGTGHVEPVIGAYLLAAVLAFDSWRKEDQRADLLLIGVYCGFAAASKYTAWLFAAAIVVPLLALAWKRAGLRDGVAVLGPLLILVLPWLIKNAIYTGNPLFPNLYPILGGERWSETQEIHYRLAMRTVEGAGPWWTWGDLWRMPFNLAFVDHYYSCPRFSSVLMLLFWISPVCARLPGERWNVLIALLGFLAWAVSVPQGRYLVAWVPVMALAVVPALALIESRSWRWRAAALLGVLAIAIHQLLFQAVRFEPGWKLLAASREEQKRRNPGYGLSQFLNRIVPQGGRVLGMWENRFFFLNRDFEADCVWQVPSVLARLRAFDDPARFAAELERDGFTHVVLHPSEMTLYFANRYAYDLTDPRTYPRERYQRDRALMARFVQAHLLPVRTMGKHRIYRLRASAAGQRISADPYCLGTGFAPDRHRCATAAAEAARGSISPARRIGSGSVLRLS